MYVCNNNIKVLWFRFTPVDLFFVFSYISPKRAIYSFFVFDVSRPKQLGGGIAQAI